MEEAGAAKALWILEKQNIQKQWTSQSAATYNHADSFGIFSRIARTDREAPTDGVLAFFEVQNNIED